MTNEELNKMYEQMKVHEHEFFEKEVERMERQSSFAGLAIFTIILGVLVFGLKLVLR